MITIYAQLPVKGFVKDLKIGDVAVLLKKKNGVFWIDLESPSHEEVMHIQDLFNFHPLCIEDCMSYSNSPKLDVFDDYLFLVTHEPEMRNDGGIPERPEIDFFLGRNFLVSWHHHPSRAVEKIKLSCHAESVSHHSGKYRSKSAKPKHDMAMFHNSDFILQAILDNIVDNFFPVIDALDDHIDEVEERVLSANANRTVLNEIILIKRQLAAFRRIISPQRDVISKLIHTTHPAVSKSSVFYFRDIYDHLIRVTEAIDSHRDAMSNILEAYYSIVSHQMNENSNKINFIMQRLTIITTIFMPLTFIAGVYGMNFDNMPERKWTYAYFVVLSVMLAITLLMIYFFRKRKWF
ncbi:magnesium/cobalt transporter CorA [bacterium]|nr:magnesium/cobalt transporter CorA [bacterium]